MRYLVLGAGQQGRVVADNLAARADTEEVVVADAAPRAPAPRVRPIQIDARDAAAVREAARGVDAAVTTLPASIGTVALPALLDARVPVVDVSFTTVLPFHLDAAARAAGVPVLVDFGVAPGLSHVLAADVRRELGGLDRLTILVGGLPLAPPPVFRHAVYFHARDLVDEYLRPARVRRRGKDEALDPLASDVTALRDAHAGDLEAFLSDGLRSLLASYPDVPEMEERTLRVPGHLDAMRTLAALGLLDGEAADGTARALDRRFPGHAHPDRLLLEVWGERAGRRAARRVHVVREGATTAMAASTAYSAAAAAATLAARAFDAPGVHAPERLGEEPRATGRLLDDLSARGIVVERASRLGPR